MFFVFSRGFCRGCAEMVFITIVGAAAFQILEQGNARRRISIEGGSSLLKSAGVVPPFPRRAVA